MLRLFRAIIVTMAISSAQAVEPARVVLTDMEQNIYKEATQLLSSDLAPDSPVKWSVRKYMLKGGKQEGIDIIDVNNGKLGFTVVPTHGMSIQNVLLGEFRLGPASSQKNLIHPKYLDIQTAQNLQRPEGVNEWMTRSVLTPPEAIEPNASDDANAVADVAWMSQHTIAVTPASHVEAIVEREAPYRVRIRGRVDQTNMDGAKLELWTEISTVPGGNSFQISDELTNRSEFEQQFGVIYHTSYGDLLVQKGARFFGPLRRVTPSDEHSAPNVSVFDRYPGLIDGSAKQVYCLQLWADGNNRTRIMLNNAARDKAVSMAFSVKQLPFLALWKDPAADEDGYAMGLEPSTGFAYNRAIEREFSQTLKLAPNQSRPFVIDFDFHAGTDEVGVAVAQVAQIWAGRRSKFDTSPSVSAKMTLDEIIRAARTWGPAYTSWYGKPAPDFVLSDIAGREHKLSDYRGKNVMLVFWATWCGPCRIEIPHLIELRNAVSEDDLAMLAISNERPNLVKRFVARAEMNYTILLDRGTMPDPYNTIRAIPCSFFIDPEGKIKLATAGLLSLDEIKAILEAPSQTGRP